jgi:predicted lactoylglutathione lyase
MINSIFVNLPVKSLKTAVDFFTALGFKFNPQFTDETSTCMLVGDNIYVMLLEHAKFAGFIDKPIAPSTSNEAILAFGLN